MLIMIIQQAKCAGGYVVTTTGDWVFFKIAPCCSEKPQNIWRLPSDSD